jgi:thioredoxin-like negative regulator of GroEL
MKDKFNIILVLVIFIVPVLIYSYTKSPQNQTSNTAEAVTKKPVVIDFYSTMCYECKKLDKVMKPIDP